MAKKTTKKKPAKKPAKKPTAKKPATKPVASNAAEREAALFLKQFDAGEIDNAWDVIGDLAELDKKLSKSSPLRQDFDAMFAEVETICRESAGGGD